MTQSPLAIYREFVKSHPDYERVINLEYLPHEKFKVDELWRPKSVKILFLAEAPSWHSKGETPSWHSPGPYFYDPKYDYDRGQIGKIIFHNLEIVGKNRREQLEEFKRRGYFFTDVIKCIYNKNPKKGGKNIPPEIIETSAKEFLQKELAELSPKVIFLLGKTPLTAMKSLDGFKRGLSGYESITRSCGTSVEVDGIKVIFCVFLSPRNFVYQDRIKTAFELISLLRTR